MEVVRSIADVRRIRRSLSGSFGLVPTMGFLHEGHLALVQRARLENDHVGVSIFVNPTQFSPTEDLAAYPRDLDRDLRLLDTLGVDLVWTPDAEEVYPPGFQTYVTVEEVTRPLEGASRPTHFRGVATVVAKLFNVFQPDRAYFGQKDAQQAVVIQRMAADLSFPLEVVICPIVRERDGLAKSSRNIYLTPAQRSAATVLSRALSAARQAWEGGERDGERLRQAMLKVLNTEPLAAVDYVSAADPTTLTELGTAADGVLLSMAVRVGRARLIDNLKLS
ncbi:MAG TPA: pantoate--beta-alanine ligase [Phycisphaerae bacterium]|nr:pantoate--beta-alanine ligase [Phycisphaerae bacterium]